MEEARSSQRVPAIARGMSLSFAPEVELEPMTDALI
jgi:hypothetical protein